MYRYNAQSMSNSSGYNNYNMPMIPNGLFVPSSQLSPKIEFEPSVVGSSGSDIMDKAMSSVKSTNLSKIDPLKHEKYTIDPATGLSTAGVSANQFASDFKKSIADGSTKGQAATSAGIGLASTAATIGGEHMVKNKKEIGGRALQGASMGASIGAAFTPVGAAIGAGIGAAAGAVVGSIEQKKRLESESKFEKERKKYNSEIDRVNKVNMGIASDLDKMQRITNSVRGAKVYKSGGILKYKPYSIEDLFDELIPSFQFGGQVGSDEQETMKRISLEVVKLSKKFTPEEISKKLRIPKKAVSMILAKYQEYIEKNPEGAIEETQPEFKKGGKMLKCKTGCGCVGCKKPSIRMFRRGGVLDIQKRNVIVDGPSHDEENNTNVKGDKGLPVVKNGIKVAEIESEELVINEESARKLEILKSKAKSGKAEDVEALADFMMKELSENTYDYSGVTK
jgi:hypothetical protein